MAENIVTIEAVHNYYANLKTAYEGILEFQVKARKVMAREAAEEELRNEYPSLMESWEEYQVKLRLIQSGNSSL